jgi:hypothetical protein
MKKNDIVARLAGAHISDQQQCGKQLAHQMTNAVKEQNPGMQTHQAALDARRAMEQRFIAPHQPAKSYGAAINQGVKHYVACLPAGKQPMAPSVAGNVAQKVYNALGVPVQKGGCGIHAVPITRIKGGK